ncbi:hsp90 co-chaperone Cdc37-like 1 [Phyllobates terribilis]|uniref:hsp90 co-chaperone Cdc37-like 1 n=1 Tax=Phyllobates terribilis TaxID=111132 RepID=UPI003CCB6EF1
MDYPCQPQYEGARSSMACMWSLAEAQQKLNSLALHNSESIDQEQAKAQAEVSELQRSEEEWKRKEAALPLGENWGMSSSDAFSQDVFNKSFINRPKNQEDEDESLSFIQKYEVKIRHFGMLGRWNDSQCFLSEYPNLVCEETARYLLLWCYHLQSEQKNALMEQVAHQAVVMQFIIEMAKSCDVDPRGCFRLFFQKAKAEEQGYFETFKGELEAFKLRVRMHTDSQRCSATMGQNSSFHSDFGNVRTMRTPGLGLPDVQQLDQVHLTEQMGEEDTKMMDVL